MATRSLDVPRKQSNRSPRRHRRSRDVREARQALPPL